jgi:hypothetical protein
MAEKQYHNYKSDTLREAMFILNSGWDFDRKSHFLMLSDVRDLDKQLVKADTELAAAQARIAELEAVIKAQAGEIARVTGVIQFLDGAYLSHEITDLEEITLALGEALKGNKE